MDTICVGKQELKEVIDWLQACMNVIGTCPECQMAQKRATTPYHASHLSDCEIGRLLRAMYTRLGVELDATNLYL